MRLKEQGSPERTIMFRQGARVFHFFIVLPRSTGMAKGRKSGFCRYLCLSLSLPECRLNSVAGLPEAVDDESVAQEAKKCGAGVAFVNRVAG